MLGMTIHHRIKERRLALGMSLQTLGEKVGVSWQTVQQWERPDGTMPLRKRRERLCEALEVTPEWLETGQETPAQPEVPAGTTLTPLNVNEALQVEYYRNLTAEQQRDLLETMRQIAEANRVTTKAMGKQLRTIANNRIEETYGLPRKRATTK